MILIYCVWLENVRKDNGVKLKETW